MTALREPLIKESSSAGKILRGGLRALIKNKGQVSPTKTSISMSPLLDKTKDPLMIKKMRRSGLKPSKMAGVSKDPSREITKGINEYKKQDLLFNNGIVDRIKGNFNSARRTIREKTLGKKNKKAIKGIVAYHEAAERGTAKRYAQSQAAAENGHNSISGVIGRAEHNNLRKEVFDKDLKKTKDFMRSVRNESGEVRKLRNITPENKRGIKIEYGDKNSPRINRSLALRMQAKERGLDLTQPPKVLKKRLRNDKKFEDASMKHLYNL
jgi:hypothetical protein